MTKRSAPPGFGTKKHGAAHGLLEGTTTPSLMNFSMIVRIAS